MRDHHCRKLTCCLLEFYILLKLLESSCTALTWKIIPLRLKIVSIATEYCSIDKQALQSV